jgi:hypothetical protein
MKRALELLTALVALGAAVTAVFVGYAILETWRPEHTNMLVFGGFIILAVLVVTIGWVVNNVLNNGIVGAQRRRDENNVAPPPYYAQPPPPPQYNSTDFLRHENLALDLERKRLLLEQARQKALPQPAGRDPLEEFYKGQENFFFADQQVPQPAQPLLTGDDDEW